jgi:hypothetical protein
MSFSASRVLPAIVCGFVLCSAAELGSAPQLPRLQSPSQARASTVLGRLPIDFIENRGQWPAPVKFAARKGAIFAAFEADAIRLQVGQAAAPVALVFEGASRNAAIAGERKRPGVYNYFIGRDESKWRSAVPAYANLTIAGSTTGSTFASARAPIASNTTCLSQPEPIWAGSSCEPKAQRESR